MSRSVFRKPSIKKSLAAKYKGSYTRKIKKSLIPGYGTKTAGWLHPKRKLYNKAYYRTSIDTRKAFAKALTGKKGQNVSTNTSDEKLPSGFWDVLMIIITAILLTTCHIFFAIIFIFLIGWHVINTEKQEDQ